MRHFPSRSECLHGSGKFHASRRWALDRIEASASMDGRSGSLLAPIILCVGSFSIGRKCAAKEDADGCMDATGQYAANDQGQRRWISPAEAI